MSETLAGIIVIFVPWAIWMLYEFRPLRCPQCRTKLDNLRYCDECCIEWDKSEVE